MADSQSSHHILVFNCKEGEGYIKQAWNTETFLKLF